MTRAAFENVKDQIGGCGIWCGSCALGNGSLRELATRLNAVLDAHGASHWVPPEMDYPAFSAGLDTIVDVAECAGCRRGGGRDDCALRACSVERGQTTCAACPELGSCTHDEILQHMRDGARRAGLQVVDPGEDRSTILREWQAKLPTTWPGLILFLDER